MDHSLQDDAPHPLTVFGGRGCQKLTGEICSYLDVQPGKCFNHPFPNGETFVRVGPDVRGKDVFVVVSLCRQHNADEHGYTGINDTVMELLVFGDTLRRASAHRLTAVIPCFGYARQDRKTEGRTPITARLVADAIVMAGFNRVLTMDLHADQIQGFFPRDVPLDHLNAGPLFANHYEHAGIENAVVLSPDVGNLKKAGKRRIGFPGDVEIAVIDKVRDKDGNVTSQRLVGKVAGKNVLIFDDIIATAGTMRNAIDLAIEHGALAFYLSATHGEFVGSAIERLQHDLIKEVCITDTIPVLSRMKELPLKVLGTAELLGDAICCIHRYESISALLGPYG